MKQVEKHGIFEWRGEAESAPAAVFRLGGREVRVQGFRISESEYAVRFMPDAEGEWQYRIARGGAAAATVGTEGAAATDTASAGGTDAKGAAAGCAVAEGAFACVPGAAGCHGKVAADGFGFRHADGTAYRPVGTTCYAWIHQTPELEAQTLETLAAAPFNKIRMCVFPKHMPFNGNDPELYPFRRGASGKWDVSRPDFRFWEHLEGAVGRLGDLGIEADLILFHPYDRWGFAEFGMDECMAYLDYCIGRLSAYRNVWWSLANEYDFVFSRKAGDWDAFGRKLMADDPYGHLISIHNGFTLYPKKEWMTHLSVQNGETERVREWREEYRLPVIIDECGYEGDIEFGWGNLSAFELVNRAWTAVACGGFITHGETFYREDEVLWWAKGGRLYGESPARFAFLRELQDEIGDISPRAMQMPGQSPNGDQPGGAPEAGARAGSGTGAESRAESGEGAVPEASGAPGSGLGGAPEAGLGGAPAPEPESKSESELEQKAKQQASEFMKLIMSMPEEKRISAVRKLAPLVARNED
ncbi:MAG: DUF4038 domain-containing protein, partial [Clostridiales bacterium]|nr:DUF4038 domain-containing protein [Clostridiales bacterium]